MHRFVPAACAVAALSGAVASPATAALPLDTLPTATGATPTDVVSTGRFSWFAQSGSKIGRISEDGTVTEFPSGMDFVRRIEIGPCSRGRDSSIPTPSCGRRICGTPSLSRPEF